MAACTSRAAASMFRFKSNCSVMLVDPSVLDDVISVTAAMRPNCRSSGVATDEAMVSGLAPGRPAQLGPGPAAHRQRHGAEQRGHGCHHDRAEAQEAGLIYGVGRFHALLALGVQSEIDHHDGVLFHDAD